MSGTADQRHCNSCNKTVHNLATLTPRQIEHLVHTNNGHLCARITRRHDGSLVTIEPVTQRPYAALFALSAALTASSSAFAQTAMSSGQNAMQSSAKLEEQSTPGHGAVTGVVTDVDGALVVGAIVTVIDKTEAIAFTTTDGRGQFRVVVPLGDYQLRVAAQAFAPSNTSLTVTNLGSSIGTIALRPGVSTMVTVTALQTDYTTMGAVASTLTSRRQRIAYRLRHPVAYLKYITHPRPQ